MAPASDRPCGPTKPGAARPAGPGRRHSSAHAYGARAALPNLVLQLARRRRHANTRASGCCGAVVNGTPRGPRGRPRCSCPIGYARGVTRAQRGSGPSPVLWPSVGLPRHAGISGVPPPSTSWPSRSAHSAAEGRSSARIGAGGGEFGRFRGGAAPLAGPSQNRSGVRRARSSQRRPASAGHQRGRWSLQSYGRAAVNRQQVYSMPVTGAG